MTTLFREGERALLLDTKRSRYLVTLVADGEFHSHAGFVAHADIIGKPEGSWVTSTRGAEYTVLRPTLEDFVVEMPRGAQVIYPKDLAPICMLADIGPGVRVFETGVGSGALSMTMLRWGAEIVGYELREDFANRAMANVSSFVGEDALARYTVRIADSYEGIDADDIGGRWFRPGRPRPTRALERRAPCRAGARSRRHPRRLHAVDPPGGACARGSWPVGGSMPARSRCCIGAGTSRTRRCDPTTGWWRTPRSSPSLAGSAPAAAARPADV